MQLLTAAITRTSGQKRCPTAHAPGLRASFDFTCLPVIMSHVRIRVCIHVPIRSVCNSLAIMDHSREDALCRRRRERGKESARETPEQREARLYQRRLRDRERGYCIRCLAVISMQNLASERTRVYSLAFAALFDT